MVYSLWFIDDYLASPIMGGYNLPIEHIIYKL
jgi:hypothetical protein